MNSFGWRLKTWLSGASRAMARPKFLLGVFGILLPIGLLAIVSNSKATAILNTNPVTNVIMVNTIDDPGTAEECSLRAASNNANNKSSDANSTCAAGTGHDTIEFSLSGTIKLSGGLPAIANIFAAALIIDGTGQSVTIDGQKSFTVMTVNLFATLTLNNLEIINGVGDEGGAIESIGTLTVTNSSFTGNTTDEDGVGGAIYSDVGDLTISGSTFSNNSAQFEGGAILSEDGTTLMITDSTFSGNAQTPSVASGSGGGAIFSRGPTAITGCTFSANTATGSGGAVFQQQDSLTVSNSTFSDNGGLTSAGAAIFASAGAPVHLTNNTFSGNLASAGKGGAVSIDTATTASTATITNSILAGAGTGLECAGANFVNGGDNISDDSSCSFGTGTGASAQTLGDLVDPLLDPNGLHDNGGPTQTIALLSISPAIAAIVTGSANCPGTDQRGDVRPAATQTACDVGAFEGSTMVATATPTSTPSSAATSTSTPTPTNTATATTEPTATTTPTTVATATSSATVHPTPSPGTASITPTQTPVPTPTSTPTATTTPTTTPAPTPSVVPIALVGEGPLADSSQPQTTVTVSLPAGVLSGDALLTQIAVYDGVGSNVPVAPAGWILIRHDSANIGNKMTSWLYYKVAGASEPISYSWNITQQYAAAQLNGRVARHINLANRSIFGSERRRRQSDFRCRTVAYPRHQQRAGGLFLRCAKRHCAHSHRTGSDNFARKYHVD